MIRAAIYARFSTGHQKETSIDDQISQGKKEIERQGFTLHDVYSDQKLSGSAPMSSRPGGSKLLAAALAGEFEVLIIESLDRAFRDLVEQETVVRNLEFAEIRIIGIADGYDTQSSSRKIMRIFQGMKNEEYIDDLRKKTHRGLTGQFERGFHTGGLPYGYKTVTIGEEGHHLQVDEEKAKVVRWIFQEYAAGKSPRAIAIELNKRGIPSPRGGTWSLSAIYGNKKKACGILANETYTGLFTWNRTRWVKTPGTNKRKRIDRPESEWQRREAPELRIISQQLWNKVQKRREKSTQTYTANGRPGKTLLAGLLRCGHCEGAVIAIDKRSYGCGQQKDRGTCKPSIRVKRELLEEKLVEVVRDQVLTESTIKDLQKSIRELIKSRKNLSSDIQPMIYAKEKEITHMIDAISKVGISDALQDRLKKAENELYELKQQRMEENSLTKLPDIIPGLEKRFKKIMDNLDKYLKKDTDKARELLHSILGKVDIIEKEEQLYAELDLSQMQLLQLTGTASRVGSGGVLFSQKQLIPLRETHDTEILKLIK